MDFLHLYLCHASTRIQTELYLEPKNTVSLGALTSAQVGLPLSSDLQTRSGKTSKTLVGKQKKLEGEPQARDPSAQDAAVHTYSMQGTEKTESLIIVDGRIE